jgi:hypothetical protein
MLEEYNVPKFIELQDMRNTCMNYIIENWSDHVAEFNRHFELVDMILTMREIDNQKRIEKEKKLSNAIPLVDKDSTV